MVEQQIRTWEVLDQDVLDLLYLVPREEFVPPRAPRARLLRPGNSQLGDGASACGSRSWKPGCSRSSTVHKTDRVLEVGTGSGYLTALLAHRAAQVRSVEIKPGARRASAAATSSATASTTSRCEIGDAARGWAAPRALRRHRAHRLDAGAAARAARAARARRAPVRGGRRSAGDERAPRHLQRARRASRGTTSSRR